MRRLRPLPLLVLLVTVANLLVASSDGPASAAKPKATPPKATTQKPTTKKAATKAVSPTSLVGTWTWVRFETLLRYDDGSEVAGPTTIAPEASLTLKGGGAGAWTFSGHDVAGNPMSGSWDLDGNRITLTYDISPPIKLYRNVEVSGDKLVLRADDALMLLFAQANGLNTGTGTKIVGGRSYDELKRKK
jgi:hypothetical protein